MKLIILTLFALHCGFLLAHEGAPLEYSNLEKHEGVLYDAYTRKNNRNSPVDIRNVKFDESVANVFIIHDYQIDKDDRPIKLKNDIFQYDLNVGTVIIVDWMDYSHVTDSTSLTDDPRAPNNYFKIANHHVPLLARDLHEKIIHIRENGAKIIVLIGHGVGAHIAGQTGKLLRNKMGYEVDKIVGLDPAGLFFSSHPTLALQPSDAETMMVIHTNLNGYGFQSSIGPDDKFVNGGKKQPNCKSSKLTNDFCSHNEAWEAYSKYLRDGLVNERDEDDFPIHPYVLCLDVSSSMNKDGRWTRAIKATRKNIFNMNSNSFLGIVAFNETAKTIHDIIRTSSIIEKKYLIQSLPDSPRGDTSIGSGLRQSLNLLRAMSNANKYCSTIILISDGEDNTPEDGEYYDEDGEIPLLVVDDIQKACISVNSIALGALASKKLEEISEKTYGTVSYAMENNGSQQIVGISQALSYSIESKMDPDERPIYLPSKEVSLSDGETTEMHFMIDETIGTDTEFLFQSENVNQVDIKLTSPDGQTYLSNGTEYFTDDSTEKGFHIELAQPGQWDLTITKTSSRRRRSIRSTIEAIAQVKTHPIHGKKSSVIRLEATVSNRSLEYPNPITISAELRIGEFPIIHAEVISHIQGPNKQFIQIPLFDNGVFPDDLANDGVYKNNVIKLPETGRYLLFVTAVSKDTTKLIPKKIDYFLRDVGDCKKVQCESLKSFEREVNAGSIKLVSQSNEKTIPPHPVKDLRARIENKTDQLITLEWTPPVDKIFDVEIKSYDIRALINDTRFENGLQFDESYVVKGSLNAANSTTTKEEKIVLKVPDHIWTNVLPGQWPEFKFALKTIGFNGATSERSNIASVIVKGSLMRIYAHERDLVKTLYRKRQKYTISSKNSRYGVISVRYI